MCAQNYQRTIRSECQTIMLYVTVHASVLLCMRFLNEDVKMYQKSKFKVENMLQIERVYAWVTHCMKFSKNK